RPAQPDVNKQKHTNLKNESERAHETEEKRATGKNQVQEGHVPAAKEQRGGQHRNREHVDVFSEEEERKLHRAVFRVKTGNKLCLGFREIEGNAIRFCNRGDQVDDETERLKEDVPMRTVPAGLVLNDLSEIECAREHDDADQTHAQR